jgi:hypothetical protein
MVGNEVDRRQNRVDEMAGGEQLGLGEVRPGRLVGGFSVVQPPVQMAELARPSADYPFRLPWRRYGLVALGMRSA